jgi:hypothetical protein
MRDRLQRVRRATFAAYATFVAGAGLSVPLHSGAAAEIRDRRGRAEIGPASSTPHRARSRAGLLCS